MDEHITSIKYKKPGENKYEELSDILNELYEKINKLEKKLSDNKS